MWEIPVCVYVKKKSKSLNQAILIEHYVVILTRLISVSRSQWPRDLRHVSVARVCWDFGFECRRRNESLSISLL
jgi:hypothetical protein